MSMSEIREYVCKNRKSFSEMIFQELKEYLFTIPDDREAQKEYVKRSTGEVLAKRESKSQ